MPSHTNERPEAAEPPRSNDTPTAEREVATVVRRRVHRTSGHEPLPTTPTDRTARFGGAGR